MERVAVIGAGDSGSTVLEQLLGYGGESGRTTRQSTQIHVDWIGQDLTTEKLYAISTRHRYGQIAADMPPEGMDEQDYFRRVQPISGRATGIEKVGDKYAVTYTLYARDEAGELLKDVNGRKILDPQKQLTTHVDHVIFTTGFKQDPLPAICSRTNAEILTAQDDLSLQLKKYLTIKGAALRFKNNSPISEVQVEEPTIENGVSSYKLVVIMSNGEQQIITGNSSNSEQFQSLFTLLQKNGFIAIEKPVKPLQEVKLKDSSGEEVAAQFKNTDIFRIGPSAKLATPIWMKATPGVQAREMRMKDSDQDQDQDTRLGIQSIDKRIALWTTVPATRDFAHIVADSDTIPSKDMLSGSERSSRAVVLPSAITSTESLHSLSVEPQPDRGIPIHSTKEDMLKYMAAELNNKYEFPASMKEVVVAFALDPSNPTSYIVTTNLPITENYTYDHLVQEFVEQPLIISIVRRFLVNSPQNTSARIVLPLYEGKVRLRNVRIEEQ